MSNFRREPCSPELLGAKLKYITNRLTADWGNPGNINYETGERARRLLLFWWSRGLQREAWKEGWRVGVLERP